MTGRGSFEKSSMLQTPFRYTQWARWLLEYCVLPAAHCYRWSLFCWRLCKPPAYYRGLIRLMLFNICGIIIRNHKYTWYQAIAKISQLSLWKGVWGGVVFITWQEMMSNNHFPFFINATSLSEDALDCFMLSKPSPFKQTLRATIYAQASRCLDHKSGEYNSGEYKQFYLITYQQFLWGHKAPHRQVDDVKGSG